MRSFITSFMFVVLVVLVPGAAKAQDSFSVCAGQVADADRVGGFYLSPEPMRNCKGILGAVALVNDTDYFLTPEINGVPWSNILVQGVDGLLVTIKTAAGLYKGGIPPRTLNGPTTVYGFIPAGNIRTKVGISATGYAVNADLPWSESLVDAPLGFDMHIMSMTSVSIGLDAIQLEGSEVALSCNEIPYSVTPNVDGGHLSVDRNTGFKTITFTQGQYPCR